MPKTTEVTNELTTKAFATLYEQMLLQQQHQHNISALQQQHNTFNIKPNFRYQPDREQLQLQIQGTTGSLQTTHCSPQSGSSSSLLSISSKQGSPSSSLNDSTGSNEGTANNNSISSATNQYQKQPSMLSNTDYEAKYRAYMTQAAAAFPYSMFGLSQQHAGNTNGFATAQQQSVAMLQNFNTRQMMLENMVGFFPGAMFQRQQQQQTAINAHFQQQQQQQQHQQRNNLKVI